MSVHNRVVGVGIIFLLCLFLLLPNAVSADEEAFTDFERCVVQEYEENARTPETAYQIGECFYQIVHRRCDHMSVSMNTETMQALKSKISAHIILQYADSWFVLAAKDGHLGATEQLAQTRRRLAEL